MQRHNHKHSFYNFYSIFLIHFINRATSLYSKIQGAPLLPEIERLKILQALMPQIQSPDLFFLPRAT